MPVIQDNPTSSFARIPKETVWDTTLSCTARIVWIVGLEHHEGWIFHRDDLLSKCGVSPNSLIKALNELRNRGLVQGNFRDEDDPLTFRHFAEGDSETVSVVESDENSVELTPDDSDFSEITESENVQNMNVLDESSKFERSKSEHSSEERSKNERQTFKICAISAQNLSANNTKNNTKNNIPVSELSDYALNAPVEKFANDSHTPFDRKEWGLKRSTSEPRSVFTQQASANGLQEFFTENQPFHEQHCEVHHEEKNVRFPKHG